MLSDGRIHSCPLDKLRCTACGLIRHRHRLSPEGVAAIYDHDYSLPAMTGTAEDARGRAYADVIANAIIPLGPGARLLDVGCGSGAMLSALLAENTFIHAVGIDPAQPQPRTGAGGRLRLRRGFPEQLLDGRETFDAVVSINTIEHAADPVAFLATLRRLLRSTDRSPSSSVAVICPAATPAGNELLFFDHLWTITPAAMACFTAKAGLRLQAHRPLSGSLAGFQLFVLAADATIRETGPTNAGRDAAMPDNGTSDNGTAGDAAAYLQAWRTLDDRFTHDILRLGRPVQMFGAGQMAALLRAYAPRSWACVERLVLDRPSEAWPLDRVVAPYAVDDHASGWATLVAVHPAAQGAVAARILADGGLPLTLPPSIRH
ncbi:SAM-dependent methyltransferase [Azospirillum sp. OGB3]|uniref:class I SAM-dependent methyltransferase n=1 Tax=Azospirillum sp. OGB3 TaxID=2587012 RepID=UPI0016059717|nr:class I SAM-dependent methyltransferase [Azospirillum sp. OGB3]MBB3268199.1 SAM-dependent methyltransferase [Azospirillum sp. OGB3]